MSHASDRLLTADVHSEPALSERDDSPLATSSAVLLEPSADLAVEVGLWEAGPGTDTDVEADEVFLVVGGAGSVTFEDGSAIELRPGVLVRLRAGDRTTWEISERLRKVYVV